MAESIGKQQIKLGEDKLKLSQKAMILISLPLAFELVFVFVLFLMLHQAEVKAAQAERAKEITAASAHLSEGFISAGKALFQFSFTEDEKALKKYDQCKISIYDNFSSLKRLLRSDKKTLKEITGYEKNANLAVSYLDEARRKLEQGDHSAGKEALDTVKPLVEELYGNMTRAMRDYNKMEESSPQAEMEAKIALKQVLLCGVALNVVLAFSLANFFNRGTTARMAVLMDNTSRLKASNELNPLLRGSDEIAQLDQVFHMMAESITEASNLIKQNEARIRAVLEGLPVGVLLISTDGIIQYGNQRAAILFASPEDKLKSTTLLSLLKDQRAKPLESFAFFLEKTLERAREYTGIKGDGTEIPLEISLTEFSGSAGGYLLGVQDVTERHEIERMKKEFVAMVSHDLRTPLTSIQLTLELLSVGRYGSLNADGQVKIAKDQSSCLRLLGLINDLLDIEKLESGNMELSLQLVQISELFETTAASVTSFAEKSGVSVTVQPAPLEIICDPDRIAQVLVNLVSNAIKFSPSGSNVKLNAIRTDSYTELQVIDQGRGIPDELKETIFERFKQVKKEDATTHGGSGLGLAICKSIIESHHGTIGVKSEPNKGSTFWFRLPNLDSGADDEDYDDDDDEV
jgi:PAS domain S-box-containing protein